MKGDEKDQLALVEFEKGEAAGGGLLPQDHSHAQLRKGGATQFLLSRCISELRLLLQKSAECFAHGGGHAIFCRLPAGALHKDVRELADGTDLIDALLEDGCLVCHAAFAELLNTHGDVQHGREGDGAKVVAVGVDDETDLRRGRGVELAVLDEIGIHNGVEAFTASVGKVEEIGGQ